MYTWNIFHEDERTGERRFLGTIKADTLAEALELAGQYFEIDPGELVALRQGA